jgi:cytochrome c oxidase cbb3-type subunit 3
LLGSFVGSICWCVAQVAATTAGEPPQQPVGGFVPGQKRPPIDPAVAARGKMLYGISCQGCHGRDLRGGDMGGPNLLRSEVALKDLNGELIVPIIQGARQSAGMPAIPLSPDDSATVAAYIRSVVATIGGQGTPPSEVKPVTIVVGDASAGAAYFASNCKSCHSAEGDLQGIAAKVPTAKALQNLWVTGGMSAKGAQPPPPTVTVTLASGDRAQGQLLYQDDFVVTMRSSDGTIRSFARNGAAPAVTVVDALQFHKDMLLKYSDKDIHDVTAYLVTLK